MFDRTVFPTVSVADPQLGAVITAFAPDLLVTPPHRPVEAAVDGRRLYVAFAGSDDVLAIDRRTGLAVWHATQVGLEPGALASDPCGQRLFMMTITSQEIVTLSTDTGHVVDRTCFTWDPTPPQITRGRYLFQTATDAQSDKGPLDFLRCVSPGRAGRRAAVNWATVRWTRRCSRGSHGRCLSIPRDISTRSRTRTTSHGW